MYRIFCFYRFELLDDHEVLKFNATYYKICANFF